jgi:hypothetical protein
MGLLQKIWVKISGDSTELHKTLKGTESTVSSWAKRIAGFVGVAFGVKELIRFSTESMKMAAEVEGIKNGFAKLGKEGKEALEAMKQATRGMIMEDELMRIANRATSLGIPLKDLSTYLTFATNKAQELGRPVQELADLLINSIGRQSTRGLYQIGIATDEGTKAFKTQSGMIELVTKKLADMGVVADTAATRMSRLTTSWNETKEAWGTFLNNSPAIQSVIKWMTDIATMLGDKDLNIWQKLNGTPNQYIEFKKNMQETDSLMSDVNKKWMQKNFPKSLGQLEAIANKGNAPATPTTKEEIATIASLNEELKKAKDDYEAMDISKTKLRENQAKYIAGLQHEISLLTAAYDAEVKFSSISNINPLPQNNKTSSVFGQKTYGLAPSVSNKLAPQMKITPDMAAAADAMAYQKGLQIDADAKANALEEWRDKLSDEMAMVKEDLVNSATDMVEGIFSAMSSGDWSGFGQNLLANFASFLSNLGKLLITLGIGMDAFKKAISTMNPAVAIAAGVAMIAVAGLIKGAISNGSSAVSGGGGYSSSGSQASLQNMKIVIEGKIQGRDIYFANKRYTSESEKST